MKNESQNYFEKLNSKYSNCNLSKNVVSKLLETPCTTLHKMKVEDACKMSFEERVYLENEAFSKFEDFIEKE